MTFLRSIISIMPSYNYKKAYLQYKLDLEFIFVYKFNLEIIILLTSIFWEMALFTKKNRFLLNFQYKYVFLPLWSILCSQVIKMNPLKIENCILGAIFHPFQAVYFGKIMTFFDYFLSKKILQKILIDIRRGHLRTRFLGIKFL